MPTRSRGSQFTLYIDAIKNTGVFDGVYATVSPEVRKLIDRPPLATSWLEVRVLDELLESVWSLGGQEGLDRVVEDFARNSVQQQLGALFRLEVMVGYNQPDTFLPRINAIVGVVMVGTTIGFEPTGPCAGRFSTTYAAPVSPVRLRGWRGVLRTMLDLLDAETTIGPALLAPTHDRVSFDLTWVPRPAA